MHGAMVAEDCDDVEGELAAMIRELTGDAIPFVLSLDLHANVTRRMIQHVDAIVGYRTFPHVDFEETGARAAELLLRMVQHSWRPAMVMRKIPMILPAENSQSSHGPFADLWEEVVKGELRGQSIVSSLFPVQPWLDIEEMGSAVVVVADDLAKASEEADRLASLAWSKRHEFNVTLYSVNEAIELACKELGGGVPVVLSDSADSPGAGSTGDSNAVLKQLLELGMQDRLVCFLPIVDAPAVAKAIQAGVGSEVELSVGFTLNPNKQHGEPIVIRGEVRRIGDGRFLFDKGFIQGLEGRMGRSVLLQIGKISLLISEKEVFTGEPNMYRSMGLEPKDADVILVKSANQFRSGYESITQKIYILDTPGCSPADIKKLEFHRVQRPCYPFDDHFNWKA